MTLTQVSRLFRIGVVFLIIAVIVYYISILIIIPIGSSLYAAAFPKKDPPNNYYGLLPPLEFVEYKTKNAGAPIFKLDTKDGRLPSELPKKITVYKVEKPIPSFEKGKDAIRTAQALGFNDADLVSSLKDVVYEWKKIESGGVLKIDTESKVVNLTTPLEGKTALFPRGSISTGDAIKEATKLLTDVGRFNDELYRTGKQEVTLGRYNGNIIEQTTNALDAQIARVDFYRGIGDYAILGPDPREGLINLYVRGPQKEKVFYNFPVMESYNWEIQTQSNATYGVIPVSTAWEHIKNNRGVISNITPENSSNLSEYTPVAVDEVFINNIYLAYYDNKSSQKFLQPVYVFEGKYTTEGTQGGKITYYYPAVTPEWIQPTQ